MFGNQIEKNKIVGAFGKWGGEGTCIRVFGGVSWGKETTWKMKA